MDAWFPWCETNITRFSPLKFHLWQVKLICNLLLLKYKQWIMDIVNGIVSDDDGYVDEYKLFNGYIYLL